MKVETASTHKKIVVETLEGERQVGYVNPRTFDRPDGLEFLDPAGQMQLTPWKNVRIAWFVQDWNHPLPPPEQRSFERRPRLEGLWVRVHFHDKAALEGVLVNDLLHTSEHGYLLTPPDLSGNSQKAFIPRAALARMEVLSVNPNRGTHLSRRKRPAAEPGRQPRLFSE